MATRTAGLLTLLGGGLWLVDDPPPVVHVNKDSGLFSEWPSELYGGGSLSPQTVRAECK